MWWDVTVLTRAGMTRVLVSASLGWMWLMSVGPCARVGMGYNVGIGSLRMAFQ